MTEPRGLPVLAFDGAAHGDVVAIDLAVLIGTRLGIAARSGGGKSRALRALLEGTHGQVQQWILDPEGEYVSLRERFPYVHVGPGGEVPARPETAGPLGRRLLELGASAIFDLSDLAPGDRQAFAAGLLDGLLDAPPELWRPLLLAIDEGRLFAPESGQGEATSTGSVIRLATQGRKRGYCLVLATQRLTAVRKDVLAELQNWLVGPTSYPSDRARAVELLGISRHEGAGLKSLSPGEFYAVGPALATEPVLVHTGPVLTTHPEPGHVVPPAPPAPEAIRKLLGQLADVAEAPAPARSSAASPASSDELEALRAELADERQQVVDLAQIAVDLEDERDALREQLGALREEWIAPAGRKLLAALSSIDAARQAVDEAADGLSVAASRSFAAARSLTDEPDGSPPDGSEAATPKPGPVRPPAPGTAIGAVREAAVDASPASTAAVPSDAPRGASPRQRILDALLTLRELGFDRSDSLATAALAGLTAGGGHWNKLTAGLAEDGLVVGGLLTPRGERSARRLPIETLAAYHACWLARASGASARVLQVLLAAGADGLPRAEVAKAAGLTEGGGAWNAAIGRLRALGAIDVRRRGRLAAASRLFPPGLAS